MWPFFRRPSRSTSPRTNRPSFKPSLESLECRNLMSHTINVAVPINNQVLDFAKAHVGQIVGDGQCATLAAAAVSSGKGTPYYKLGPTGPNADYVWGKLVTTLTPTNGNVSAITPGDILQFSNVTEVDKMTVTYANGSSKTYTSYQYPFHHTAIVSAVGGGIDKYDLQVLQSNVDLGLKIPNASKLQLEDQGGIYWGGTHTYHIDYPSQGFSITYTHSMTSGVIKVYQPYQNITLRVP